MNERETLYYALGHLAYAVAKSDGEVQKEERQILHDVVTREVKARISPEVNISEIIFSILQQQSESSKVTFDRAMKELKNSKRFFTPQMEEQFVEILYAVAEAFPPIEVAEKEVIDRFKLEIKKL